MGGKLFTLMALLPAMLVAGENPHAFRYNIHRSVAADADGLAIYSIYKAPDGSEHRRGDSNDPYQGSYTTIPGPDGVRILVRRDGLPISADPQTYQLINGQTASAVLGLIDGYDYLTATFGYDPFTGKMSSGERLVTLGAAAIPAVPGVVARGALRHGARAVAEVVEGWTVHMEKKAIKALNSRSLPDHVKVNSMEFIQSVQTRGMQATCRQAGYHVEPLRDGLFSARVNNRYRLIFRYDESKRKSIVVTHITDYHDHPIR
jgi:plasmid maintenance system killer protein